MTWLPARPYYLPNRFDLKTVFEKGDIMKKILAVTLALSAATSAFAGDKLFDAYGSRVQRQEAATNVPTADIGVRHMLEFNAQSLPTLVLGFKRDKSGGSAETGTDLKFSANYAYGIHKFLQAAFRFNYNSALSGGSTSGTDVENVGGQIGLIVNSDSDFTNAAYVSLYVGAGYEQNFGAGTREDLRTTQLAVGKRIPMARWGVKHVVYSPEIALVNTNSTTNASFDYRQAVELRLFQFSAFF